MGGGIAAAVIIAAIVFSVMPSEPQPVDILDDVDENNATLQEIEKPKVLASFYPYYQFAKNVAGDTAIVEQYLPGGVEAHDWEPDSQKILSLKSADVFVYNGLGMEPYVDNLINSGEFENVLFVKSSEGVELMKPGEHDEHDEREHTKKFASELEEIIEEFEHGHMDGSQAIEMIDEILHEHEGDGHDHGGNTIEMIEDILHEIKDGHVSTEDGLEEIHNIVLEIEDDHGAKEHDEHGHDEHHAFEWAGVFDLNAGTYYWSFAKVDGDYADPAMKMIVLESDDIESSEELAETLLESDNVEYKNHGNELIAKETAYLLNFDDTMEMTVFSVNIDKDGKYAFFTEHMPFEFEADEHFFKDESRGDVEPVMQEPDSDHDHGHGHHHDFEFDPHIWLDPILVKQQVSNIRDGLVMVDPQNKENYEQNAKAYNEKLDALDMKFRSTLTSCNKDTFVPFHNAFAYLGERYDLEIMSLGGLAPEAEASAAEIAEFIDFIQDNDIKVIFVEEVIDPRLAEVVANEAGAEILLLSPLEAVGSDISYIDKMEQNLDALMVALECQ